MDIETKGYMTMKDRRDWTRKTNSRTQY